LTQASESCVASAILTRIKNVSIVIAKAFMIVCLRLTLLYIPFPFIYTPFMLFNLILNADNNPRYTYICIYICKL
jgi:hypothetical protein